MATQFSILLFLCLSVMTYSVNGYSKYGRTCADIGCPSTEVCVMAEDPCTYGRRDECGSYPTCQRRTNIVKTCDNFVCPPTMFCRLDGDTPKCIPDNGPLGGRNGNPNANVDPHNIHGGNSGEHHQPSAPLYPQIPRGQTTTRAPVYRPNGGGSGGYQGGSIGSGYPGNGGGGYGGGSIGGGYPGGYSGYPGMNNNQRYPGYPGYPSSGSNGYPNNGYSSGGHSNTNYNPYNSNPYYTPNNNQYPYGHNAATTSNPIYEGLKSLGIFCYMLHALIAHARQL